MVTCVLVPSGVQAARVAIHSTCGTRMCTMHTGALYATSAHTERCGRMRAQVSQHTSILRPVNVLYPAPWHPLYTGLYGLLGELPVAKAASLNAHTPRWARADAALQCNKSALHVAAHHGQRSGACFAQQHRNMTRKSVHSGHQFQGHQL